MNLCVDVGNSTINVGVFKEDSLLKSLVLTTDIMKTSDEYQAVIIKELISIKEIKAEQVSNITYSSVVPEINVSLKEALKSVFTNASLLTIGPGVKTGLAINVDNPVEIGNDLIADLVGAKAKYSYPLIVADLGTASKILLIDKDGYFSSALIVPGLVLSANGLSKKASLLPTISLEKPKSVLARNTFDAMNAGIVYGHAEMISGLIRLMEKELGYSCKHILTGGSSSLLKDLMEDYHYEPFLVLEGLNEIYKKNGGKR